MNNSKPQDGTFIIPRMRRRRRRRRRGGEEE